MKKKVILIIGLIAILTILSNLFIDVKKVKFLGFLEKGEKVEISFFEGLITKKFAYDNIKSKEDENVKHFYQINKIPILFSKQKVILKFYKNEKIVFDSIYIYEKENPTYLFGVILPKFYHEMISNGDDVSYYKFYFKTKQDDIDLEKALENLRLEEKKRK
jgi:hypothetical protein